MKKHGPSRLTSAAIAEQLTAGNFTNRARQKLERTPENIEPQLIRLLRHREPFVREVAATVLGERRKPQSIPALLGAVSDPSAFVALDAIVAIEKCAGLESGELVSALYLDLSNPQSGARRLAEWWRLVRRSVL